MKKLFIILFFSFKIFSQQEGMFTQYMVNPSFFNPAYTVTKNSPSFYIQQRQQWDELEGSPKTDFFSYQHPSIFENLGFGLNIMNDKLGPVNEFNASIDFSTLVRVSDKWNTSVGLKLSYNNLSVNFNLLNIYNPTDPYFQSNIENLSYFNIGIGFFIHNETTYFGFSSPSILKQNYFENDSFLYKASDEQHYYLTAGHVINLSVNIKLKPSFIIRHVSDLPMQYDLSLNTFFYDKFILGTSYRLNSSLSAMAGFYLSKSLLIGYSHDSETNRLKNFAGNNSEFFLKWEIRPKEIINPRFF
jgi:type IX secretion system PorP/SprF family membrane protein